MEKQFWIGAAAFYPAETYCALTRTMGDKFADSVEWTRELDRTTTPQTAIMKAISFFRDKNVKLDALTFSFYGVVQGSKFHGSPQKNWIDDFDIWDELSNCHIDSILKHSNEDKNGIRISARDRVRFHTDAALGAIGEYLWGAGKDIRSQNSSDQHNLAYFKVRDGIGSGVILAGRLWQGAGQPEMGHLPIRRANNDDFPGICAKHGDCVEGLASRAAIIQRLPAYSGEHKVKSLHDLDRHENHEIWQLEGYYLGALASTSHMVVAPKKIIFEGEVIKPHLIDKIRRSFDESVANYPISAPSKALIVSGDFLGQDATLLGGLEVSRQTAVYLGQPRCDNSPGTIKDESLDYLPIKSSDFDKSIAQMRDRASGRPTITPEKTDATTAASNPQSKWVFGLSITEKIEWAVARATDGKLQDGYESGNLCPSLSAGLAPVDRSNPIVLQKVLREGLLDLAISHPWIFNHDERKIAGIGVSTIGVVDTDRCTLDSITRKAWVPLQDGKPIVDFSQLFTLTDNNEKLLFPKETVQKRLIVQNDAPARCLTEYMYGFDGKNRPDSLLYLMIGEGVNGAAVFKGDLPHMLRHPEIGHCAAKLYPIDDPFHLADTPVRLAGGQPSSMKEFAGPESYTGCETHVTCFEGLASNARIRRQFGWDIWGLAGEAKEQAIDIVSFYVSQLVWNGVLTFNPKIVLLGGQMIQGDIGDRILEKVREQFLQSNNSYLPDYTDADEVAALIDRANFDGTIKPLSALTMACLAAFEVNKFGNPMTVRGLCRKADLPKTDK